MPLAQIYMGTGLTYEKKKDVIEKVTAAIVEAVGPLEQPVWVVLNEIPLTQWGIGGTPMKSP